jgi:hypothetical protein
MMRARRIACVFAFAAVVTTPLAAQLPSPPTGWPSHFEIGISDAPGGAAALRATAPFLFRYQYLAGGVNTGNGWSTWNTNGDFATFYIQDSVANSMIPVFTYYQLLQSSPGGGAESDADFANLNNTATMTAYYNDLILLFQKAAQFPSQRVVLHLEPDFWGYMEQRSTNDNAATVTAKVSETGIAALQGLPSTVPGFARAIVKLRDTYAPNVTLAYHLSVWGTGVDIALSDPPTTQIDALAARAATFYSSLGANFDVVFTDVADRDAAFKQFVYGDGGASWLDTTDFQNSARFLGKFATTTGTRFVIWQIPLGNTHMRAENNTSGHYQDNRVETLLDDAARTYLTAYRDAGVVALLFGGGASGVTCACDADSDGVTNPAPIGANLMASQLAAAGTAPSQTTVGGVQTLVTPYAADDDGGYFRWRVWTYYQNGSLPLAGTPPAPPTNVRIIR